MTKKWLIAIALVVVILGIYVFTNQRPSTSSTTFDPLNTSYTIDGKSVVLVGGKSEVGAATTIFGVPVSGDINNDGRADAALILVQNPGGSGTFYYVAVALNTIGGTQGTNAILLGDRVAPQNIMIKNGQIIANYAERNPGEPMTTPLSVGVSKYISFDGSALRVTNPLVGAGERCGGNMTTAPSCITGYRCAPDPNSHLPFGDVGGTCVAN